MASVVASPEKITMTRTVTMPVDPSSSSSLSKLDFDAASDHSSSSSADRDVLAQLASRSEEYRLLFRLPADEILLQDFNCALQENILIQGHMYLFVHHICFYSNIFGFETKKMISFNEITCVRKAKTAAIFPNAIEIVTEGKKHFFGSFLSRDEAYRLIVGGWAQHNHEVKALLERQDSKSETSSDISNFVFERVQTSRGLEDDSACSVRVKEVNVLEPSKPLLENMETNTDLEPSEFEASDTVEKATSLSGNSLTLMVENIDAPKVPDQFTLSAEAKFPILVEDFFNLFVSDRSVGFIEDFHKRCGDKDFQCTSWKQHSEFGHVRSVSFLHPVKIYFGAKFGQCKETQKFRLYRNSHLMIETSQQVGDVPFADCFQVEAIWDIEQDKSGENGCIMRVYANVAFSKKTIFRGKIEQSTKDEYRDVCAIWISMANDLLKTNPVEQLKGVADQSVCTIQEVEVQGPSIPEESSGRSHPISSSSKVAHDSMNPSLVSSPAATKVIQDGSSYAVATKAVHQDSSYFSTITLLVTELWITMVSYFKARSPLFRVSVAFFAILFLLQVSFIYHVTRVPEVRVVIHDSSSIGKAGFNVENIEWLENRFNYLKDAMALLETQMDSMRHEYTLLKAHLQQLEQYKAKL